MCFFVLLLSPLVLNLCCMSFVFSAKATWLKQESVWFVYCSVSPVLFLKHSSQATWQKEKELGLLLKLLLLLLLGLKDWGKKPPPFPPQLPKLAKGMCTCFLICFPCASLLSFP